jgi:HEPN domain-containing protein
MTDVNLPAEWFAQGNLDIQAVEILLSQSGPLEIVAFHLQQAVEKYLKGFLLASG